MNNFSDTPTPKPVVRQVVKVLEAGVKTPGGYRYSLETLHDIVAQFECQPVSVGIICDTSEVPSLETNLSDVSHRVTSLWVDGNALYGEVEVLDTPKGLLAKQMLENGTNPVSMGAKIRGTGTVPRSGGEVQNYEFLRIDIGLES